MLKELARSAIAALALTAAAHAASPFRQGINITRLFDSAQKSGAEIFVPWTNELSPAELARLRAAGFDFIRLPVDPGPLIAAPDTMRAEALTRLFDFLRTAQQAGFAVIVDLHPRPGGDYSPAQILAAPDSPKFAQYSGFARMLAARLQASANPRLALELMNEPQSACVKTSGTDWTVFQSGLYRDVRAAAPLLNLVVTGGCYSGVDGLQYLDLQNLRDSRLFVMVHFYEPQFFTHQGAPWSNLTRGLAGLVYPPEPSAEDQTFATSAAWAQQKGLPPDGGDAERKVRDYYSKPFDGRAVQDRLSVAAAWADRQGIARDHIIVGEFGVMWEGGGLGTGAEALRSRAQWLHDVSHAASSFGFGWAVWGYHGGFGIVSDNAARVLDPTVTQALFGR
jgi:hypothetical protein